MRFGSSFLKATSSSHRDSAAVSLYCGLKRQPSAACFPGNRRVRLFSVTCGKGHEPPSIQICRLADIFHLQGQVNHARPSKPRKKVPILSGFFGAKCARAVSEPVFGFGGSNSTLFWRYSPPAFWAWRICNNIAGPLLVVARLTPRPVARTTTVFEHAGSREKAASLVIFDKRARGYKPRGLQSPLKIVRLAMRAWRSCRVAPS